VSLNFFNCASLFYSLSMNSSDEVHVS